MKTFKKRETIIKNFDKNKKYKISAAIDYIKNNHFAKFNESIDISVNLGIDPKKSDQLVRSVVVMPHSVSKTKKILAICNDNDVEKCLEAGASFAGNEEFLKKISEGWCDFDILVTIPTMMIKLGKLGKILGPKGLMPNPKTGGVSVDIVKSVQEIKKGRVEVKSDKYGIVHNTVGKMNLEKNKIVENIKFFLSSLAKLKPATSKGNFMKNITLCSTMGCGLKLDINNL